MDKANKKILIVEDDKNFLWLLRQAFSRENLSVLFALDGEEGLNVAEKEKPDLIIIDILLPKMNGITLAKKLREENIRSQIIFLTNLKDAEHMSEAIEKAGEIDYIIKSDLHIEQVVARVKERLRIK